MKKKEPKTKYDIAKHICIGAAIGYIIIFALSAILSAVVLSGKIDDSLMGASTVALCFVGAVAASAYSIGKINTRKLLIGFATALVMFLVILAFSAFSDKRAETMNLLVFKFIALLAGVGIAGVIKLKRKKRKRG